MGDGELLLLQSGQFLCYVKGYGKVRETSPGTFEHIYLLLTSVLAS